MLTQTNLICIATFMDLETVEEDHAPHDRVQAGEEADLRIVERGAVRLEADPPLHGDRHSADDDGADRSSPHDSSEGAFEYGPGGESWAVVAVRCGADAAQHQAKRRLHG